MLKLLLIFFLSLEAQAFSKNQIVKDCKEKAKGPCYEFSGRARLYNNRHVRIWKKGSNRLYQVANHTAEAFGELKHLSQATEIHADFNVCFLKPEEASGYSEICIQSVKSVKTSTMPE